MISIPASAMVSPGINCRRVIVFLLAIEAALSLASQELKEGDLLFVCNDKGNAITQVTSGVEGLPIDHVAIVHRIGGDNGLLFVIEAVNPAVCLTPIDTFLCENGRVLLGRVNVDLDMKKSVKRCLAMVGKPYDDLYLPGDSALYCSELVQLNYIDVEGKPIFETIPMSFHDSTGQITDYWRGFYETHGMRVPEGQPGTNPGELSRSELVTIIGWFGN